MKNSWFIDGDSAWAPAVYEWFFVRTRWGRRLRRDEEEVIHDALSACLNVSDQVLEVGAGTGNYTALLDRVAARVDVREPAASMRNFLRRRAAREHWTRTSVTEGRLPDLQVVTHYDGALAIGVLNYVGDFLHSLQGLADCLAPGGWLVVNVPADSPRGHRYAALEALGRRRVHCRPSREVKLAAAAAQLSIVEGPIAAGVTDVYRLVRDR